VHGDVGFVQIHGRGARGPSADDARHLGASEENLLITQGNLANSYKQLGRTECALSLRREVDFGRLKLSGEEHRETLREADNYALSLCELQRFEEAKLLLRKTMPVARRVLGPSHELTIRISRSYAKALYEADGATLDDLHEAVTTLEDTARIARRVLGSAHPLAELIEQHLQLSRAALRARETPSPV